MKKILSYILKQLRYFFINPFWVKWQVLVILVISVLTNGLIWYLYLSSYKSYVNLTPIIYSLGVLILNLFIANLVYPKKEIVAYILISLGLIIQFIILIYLKIALMSGAF